MPAPSLGPSRTPFCSGWVTWHLASRPVQPAGVGLHLRLPRAWGQHLQKHRGAGSGGRQAGLKGCFAGEEAVLGRTLLGTEHVSSGSCAEAPGVVAFGGGSGVNWFR